MATAVLTLPLRTQEDVLLARRRARDLAALLQFTPAEQIGLSTAVWEVVRLAERQGEVELAVVEAPPSVAARITVSGVPRSALLGGDAPGLDLDALQRLVDRVEARDVNGRAVVRLSAAAGPDAWVPGVDELGLVLASLTRYDTGGGGPGILDELRQQNFELLTTLATLREREQDLTRLNAELADKNRAVTALYAELEVQAGELRRRAEAIARFLSSLTHELRTPLYAVRGMTEAILRDHAADLTEAMRDDVRLIDGAMVEALDLVNDSLDMAKVAAGRTIVRLSDVDVPEMFATLRAILTNLPSKPNVQLGFEEPHDVPVMRTDAFKLSQILRNFIVNALKFTDQGFVRVSAHALDGGEKVRFEVADTGRGCPRRTSSERSTSSCSSARSATASCAEPGSACRSPAGSRPSSGARWACARRSARAPRSASRCPSATRRASRASTSSTTRTPIPTTWSECGTLRRSQAARYARVGAPLRDGVIGNTRDSGSRIWGSSPCPAAPCRRPRSGAVSRSGRPCGVQRAAFGLLIALPGRWRHLRRETPRAVAGLRGIELPRRRDGELARSVSRRRPVGRAGRTPRAGGSPPSGCAAAARKPVVAGFRRGVAGQRPREWRISWPKP